MINKLSFNAIKGMRLDISPSKASPEYIFDARNIRLTARDGNTLLSITNEKGNEEVTRFNGKVLGYCVLNNYLITFTRSTTTKTYKPPIEWEPKSITVSARANTVTVVEEYINRTYKTSLGVWTTDILYYSEGGGLNFVSDILTLGIYENDNILKVYWIDGVNLPRVINIVKDILLNKTVSDVRLTYNDYSFDFVPRLELNEEVTVTNIMEGNGRFSSGIVQYAFTYFNKYGLESNIFYVSDLNYVTYPSRGGSPDDKISNSFRIQINNLDSNFEYIRIYSIHRTSLDATPEVKKIIDLPRESLVSDSILSSAYYKRFTGNLMVSLLGDNTYVDCSTLSYLLLYNIKPSFSGEPAKAANGDYYVFSKGDFPNLRINTTDNTVICFNDTTDYIFISAEAVGGLGDNSQRIIIPDGGLSTTLGIVLLERKAEAVNFVDNNTVGEIVDSTLLLYIGGEDIISNSIILKDLTLFLGNITISRPIIPNYIKELLCPKISSSSTTNRLSILLDMRTILTTNSGNLYYKYSNQLVAGNTTTFKIGEHYRLGLLFQYLNGKWSEPIPISYSKVVNANIGNTRYEPYVEYNDNNIIYHLPYLYVNIPSNVLSQLIELGYKKARALVVNPSLNDRLVLLLGMICPTVYTKEDREGKGTYALSSWFLRPFNVGGDSLVTAGTYIGTALLYKNYGGGNITNENTLYILGIIQNNSSSEINTNSIVKSFYPLSTEIEYLDYESISPTLSGNTVYKIDLKFLTLHSPDIEFDSDVATLDLLKFNSRIVGVIEFDANLGDIDILTSSPTISSKSNGFTHISTSVLAKDEETKNFGGRSLVSGFYYLDDVVDDLNNEGKFMPWGKDLGYYFVCPWQCSGSLNNDINRPANSGTLSAVLKRKVISNIKVSFNNKYFEATNITVGQIGVFNSNELSLLKVDNKAYLGNVDTLLTPSKYYSKVIYGMITDKNQISSSINTIDMIYGDKLTGDFYIDLRKKKVSIRMKYKSSPHIVFLTSNALNLIEGLKHTDKSFLYLGELYRNLSDINNPFGGTSDAAIQSNQWIPSGLPVSLSATKETKVDFLHGDCWYLRYDCLKTYPFTLEDENSIVEIGSFMVETRVNIDGRYDRNRGLASNLNMTPLNFNLLNHVYTLKDNYFNYRILDLDFYKLNKFPNTITWTKEKSMAETVDTWTNINVSNTFDVDGDLGQIKVIKNYNNELYCFQDKGVSRILFNNRVLIPTSDNVPIEISNGYKVQGKMYISNTVGCLNWKSAIVTPNGIYFSDLNNSGIYLLNNNGLLDISTPRGFTNWVKQYLPSRTYYDANNGDLYFMSDFTMSYDDNSYKRCLCFSEKINEFTSFMDYSATLGMFNINNNFYSLSPPTTKSIGFGSYVTALFQQFTGDYNYIYDNTFPYYITYIANLDFTHDKIFNNIEFRADSLLDNEDKLIKSNNTKLPNICPFSKVTVWNEYLKGESELTNTLMRPSPLKEKFRVWRVNVPRDTINKRDRIRNPWAYIKLEGSHNNNRMLLHDMLVYYFDNSR